MERHVLRRLVVEGDPEGVIKIGAVRSGGERIAGAGMDGTDEVGARPGLEVFGDDRQAEEGEAARPAGCRSLALPGDRPRHDPEREGRLPGRRGRADEPRRAESQHHEGRHPEALDLSEHGAVR